jgi:hypothetical protein
VWKPGATADERIELLHTYIESIDQAVRDLGNDFAADRADVTRRLDELRTRLSAQVTELRNVVNAGEAHKSRIDGRALPPIVVGLLLAGLPDDLAAVPAVGWSLIVVGVALTLLAIRLALRDRRSGGPAGE